MSNVVTAMRAPQSASFPKAQRLLTRTEFKSVLDNGVKIADPLFVLIGIPRNDQQQRIGIIVSKKVGHAVMRNRIKRLVRERFRHVGWTLAGLDLVIIARQAAAEEESQEIFAALDHGFKRLRRRVSGLTH
jgi:ribonuclease P protein component